VELVLLAREYQELEQEKVFKDQQLLDQKGRVEEARGQVQTREKNGQVLQSQLLDLERELKEQQEQYYLQKTEWQRQEDLVQQVTKEIGNLEQEDLEHQRESGKSKMAPREKNRRKIPGGGSGLVFGEVFERRGKRSGAGTGRCQTQEALSRTAKATKN
jgi:chromosome segregation ATPase